MCSQESEKEPLGPAEKVDSAREVSGPLLHPWRPAIYRALAGTQLPRCREF